MLSAPFRFLNTLYIFTLYATLGIVTPAALVSTVSAQEICAGQRRMAEVINDQRYLLQLLRDRKLDELEAEFRERQLAYERGTYSEEALYLSFEAFDVAATDLTPRLEEWVHKYKGSYAALVSLAVNQKSLGSEIRGHKMARETSKEQLDSMERWMRSARKNVHRAISLARVPASAYAQAISIENYIADRKAIDAIYIAAIEVAPKSVYIRRSYLLAIDKRWHGSMSDVTAALDAIRLSVLPEDSKRALLYEGAMQLAGTSRTYRKNDQAAQFYRLAALNCDLSAPWDYLAYMDNELGLWEDQIDALNHYLHIEPGVAWAIRRKGYSYERLGDWSQANPLYLEAAELGDAYAENAYGWSLYSGRGLQRDRDGAIRWFRAAASQGNQDARANLEQALREQ